MDANGEQPLIFAVWLQIVPLPLPSVALGPIPVVVDLPRARVGIEAYRQ